MLKSGAILAAVAAAFFAAGNAEAGSVTFTNTGVDHNGTGFGNVAVLLTVQATGSDTTEYGEVTWDGSNVVKNVAQTKNTSDCPTVATIKALAGFDANDLGIVFNINQIGQSDAITLHDFDVILFNADGTVFETITYDSPDGGLDLEMFDNGQGAAGWLFRLSGISATWLANDANRMGFRINSDNSLEGFNDGPENFYIGSFAQVVPLPPAVWSGLIALGAFGLWSLRRRRQSAHLVA